MAYEPKTWVCGETITAEALNHLEQGLADCCGGGDCGFECEETMTTILEENVTTTDPGAGYADGPLSEAIYGYDSITVTFNGTEYTCQQDVEGGYGAPFDTSTWIPDWSEYPFRIGGSGLFTENAGTYSIKIEVVSESITTTDCFKKAVKSVGDVGYSCGEGRIPLLAENITTADDGTGNPVAWLQQSFYNYDSLVVTFLGTEYIAPLNLDTQSYGAQYNISTGHYDWSEYPFSISGSQFHTQNAGQYDDVIIETLGEVVTSTTDCFKKAVESVANVKVLQASPGSVGGTPVMFYQDEYGIGRQLTPNALNNAYNSGKLFVIMENTYNSKAQYFDIRAWEGSGQYNLQWGRLEGTQIWYSNDADAPYHWD